MLNKYVKKGWNPVRPTTVLAILLDHVMAADKGIKGKNIPAGAHTTARLRKRGRTLSYSEFI